MNKRYQSLSTPLEIYSFYVRKTICFSPFRDWIRASNALSRRCIPTVDSFSLGWPEFSAQRDTSQTLRGARTIAMKRNYTIWSIFSTVYHRSVVAARDLVSKNKIFSPLLSRSMPIIVPKIMIKLCLGENKIWNKFRDRLFVLVIFEKTCEVAFVKINMFVRFSPYFLLLYIFKLWFNV